MPKRHQEFFSTTDVEWRAVPGPAPGLTEAILAQDGDAGVATRLLRFAPGTDTSAAGPQVHDFSEEVLILEGELHDLALGRTFTRGMYACRPPGATHGPWTSARGCLLFEVRYP